MRSGVSRTDTRGIKLINLEICEYTQSNEPNSQMSMIRRRESSLMSLVLWPRVMVILISWFYDVIWYILFSILSWPMIPTQYPCFVLPIFMFSSCLIVECSKRAVIFDSTVSLDSHHYSGYQGELILLAWTGSSSSCLDALKFRHALAFICFSLLEYS